MSLAHAKVEVIQAQNAPETRKRPNPTPRRRLDPSVTIFLVALVILGAAMGHVAQRARITALTYELHLENLRLAEAKRVNNHLLVEVERARSLKRVEEQARNRLGMVDPAQTTWLVLNPANPQTTAEPAATGTERPGLFAAFSLWFERVRSEMRAALPRAR
jgi:Cell division protein FtsL.